MFSPTVRLLQGLLNRLHSAELPFGGYTANEAWLQLILIAMDLTGAQHLCLDGALPSPSRRSDYRLGTPYPEQSPATGITTVRLDVK